MNKWWFCTRPFSEKEFGLKYSFSTRYKEFLNMNILFRNWKFEKFKFYLYK